MFSNKTCLQHAWFQLAELRTNVDGLEKERDFYFGKLRDVEVLCQEAEYAGSALSEAVLRILYATEVVCTTSIMISSEVRK